MWMNEYDVRDAVEITSVYAPAWHRPALRLYALMEWANANSDGWPYWSAPSRASQRLQDALQEALGAVRRGEVPPDPAPALYTSMKAFCTKQQRLGRMTAEERKEIVG